MARTRTARTTGLIAILFVAALAVGVSAAGAEQTPTNQEPTLNLASNNTTTTSPPTDTTTTTAPTQCTGEPKLTRVSITSPQNTITLDKVGLVEANFRVSEKVPEDCTVIVDLQYSFAQSGFQFEGGADWEQSATDIVATEFQLESGEIRSIDAEISANGADIGDEVTVVADYEIWYKGDKEHSKQVSGIRKTLEVKPEKQPTTQPNQQETSPNDANENQQATKTGGNDPGTDDGKSIVEAIANNLVVVIAVLGLALVSVALALKKQTIIGIFSQ